MADVTTKAGVVAALYRVLAADYNVTPEFLLADGVTVTVAAELPGRRSYPMLAKPFAAMTLGAGVVISTSAERVPLVEEIVRGCSRDDLFASPILARLDAMLAKDGQSLAGPTLRHISSRDRLRRIDPPDGITIELLSGADVRRLYAHPGFGNALSYQPDHPRRDMLAVAAWRGAELVGVAGASMDAPELWQVGVDVVANERGQGTGAAIVSRIAEAIVDAGVVPYYATSTANIASRSLAQRVGFWPAWTEVYARGVD
jgi:hypothetical protein